MSEFRAALQRVLTAYDEWAGAYGVKHSKEAITQLGEIMDAAKALLARPEPEPTNIVFDNPSYEPWIASQGPRPEPDLTDKIYSMLVRRGYAQHEAHAIANGPCPEPEPRITLGQECGTSYEVVPATDAAAPMSPGKTFTAVATYTGKAIPRTVQPVDDEPEPRLTREEAMRLLDNLQTAYARMMYQKAHLGEQYDDAREACLAAMQRSEAASVITPVFKLCVAYESGFGHGLQADDLPSPYSDGSQEHEAYLVGYNEGLVKTISPPAASDGADAVEALARKRFYEVHNVSLVDLWQHQPEAVKKDYMAWARKAIASSEIEKQGE